MNLQNKVIEAKNLLSATGKDNKRKLIEGAKAYISEKGLVKSKPFSGNHKTLAIVEVINGKIKVTDEKGKEIAKDQTVSDVPEASDAASSRDAKK